MKKNLFFLQLKTFLFQPFCLFFGVSLLSLLLVGLILIFTSRKPPVFSQSPKLQNLATQSDLHQAIRKKRASVAENEQTSTDCHITRHNEAYKDLWTNLFKTVFPWLKRAKIKKIWVMTDTSVKPYIHKQFDVSAFDYHGVAKYRNWNAIPAQEKCAWFNKYPNQPRENPWLSSPFASLRGLMFYLGFLKSYHYHYKLWRVTHLFYDFLDVSYFLTLSDQQIFKNLTTRKFVFGPEPKVNNQKNFLYALGLFFLNYPGKYPTGPVITINLSGGIFLTKKHSNKHQMVSSSYVWQKFDWRAWHQMKRMIYRDLKLLDIYYYLRPLLWELNHYQIDRIKAISIANLVQESKTVVNFYALSGKAKKEYRQLISIFPSGGSSASNFAKFKQFFQLPLTAAKNKFFWKTIAPFLSKIKQYNISLWKEVDLKPLLLETPSQTFANLKAPAQAVITQLIEKFYPSITDPFQKVASLETLHQHDNYQEMIELKEELNRLFITQTDSQFCAAITDFRYQKWWEEIFRPLVPKLVEHKVTRVYYGGLRSARYKTVKWNIYDYVGFDRLFFNVARHNYYGAREYRSYQELPNEIKCQLPSFLFHPRRIKTLKSLKVYSDLFLPKLAQYQKYPFDEEDRTFHYSAYKLDFKQLVTKTEEDIFALIQQAPELKKKTKHTFIWTFAQWEWIFIYLGVLDISSKTRVDYHQKVATYFTNSQFWSEIRPHWSKIVNDQLLTSWKGSDVRGLKKQSHFKLYHQLNTANQVVLKKLMKTAPSKLLITQISTLATHLTQLDVLWKELQTLRSDLEKSSLNQLEEVEFSNLKTHLTTVNPAELPPEAKAELINLMEIDDFVGKLKESLTSFEVVDAPAKTSDDKTLIIVLSTVLPLIVFGLVGGGFFYFRKKQKAASQKVKR